VNYYFSFDFYSDDVERDVRVDVKMKVANNDYDLTFTGYDYLHNFEFELSRLSQWEYELMRSEAKRLAERYFQR
jgi:hypothetical protein